MEIPILPEYDIFKHQSIEDWREYEKEIKKYIEKKLSYDLWKGTVLRSDNYVQLSSKYNLIVYFIFDLITTGKTLRRGNLKPLYTYDEPTNTIIVN